MSEPAAPEAPALEPAPAAAGSSGAGGSPAIPLVLIGIGGYLAWFGIHYWRSQSVTWPSDPIKAVLQGKPIPANATATTATAQLTAFETQLAGGPAAQLAASGGAAAGAAAGGVNLPASSSETMVIRSILAGIGAPQNSANINSLVAWIRHEAPWSASPPDGAQYTHNPMNTTLPGYGATGNVNSVGVKIYPDWGKGIAATVATLRGYPAIIAAFKSGRGLCGNPAVAADLSKWSGGGYSSVC